MEIIFPARLSGTVDRSLGTVKVRLDENRLRAWALRGREVVQVLDVEGLSVESRAKAVRALLTVDGEIVVSRLGGCGCSLGALRRYNPPDPDVV